LATPNIRILIVEDEPVVKLHLKSCLEQMGYQVLPPASTGEEAIQAYQSQKPHLILMDIVLEGRSDGIKAAETLSREHEAPIVFLTAYSDDSTLKQARVCQPYGYIVKPFKEEDLKSTIEMALFKSKQEKILRSNLDFNASLLDSIDYPVLAVDCSENIIFLNSRIPALLGKSEIDIFGKEFDKAVPLYSENGDPLEISFSRILVSGCAEQYEGVVLNVPGGENRVVDIAVSPFRKTPEKIIGSVIIFRNVTESTLSREEKLENLKNLIQLLESQQ